MEEKKKSKKGIIITLLILIIIVLVGIGGYFGYKIWKDNQTTGTDWGDIYLNNMEEKISNGDYQDTENSNFGFLQFEESEKPAMVLNYETKSNKVMEISVLDSENNVKSKKFETEKENELDVEMLYNIESKKYNWYEHEKKQDGTEIFTEVAQNDIEEGADIAEDKKHEFTKEEMTEQEVADGEVPSIPKFDEEFVKSDIELEKTDIDLKNKDIDKKEIKEKIEKAMESYKTKKENISDEVKENIENSLKDIETKKDEIKKAEEEAKKNINVEDIYKQYIIEKQYKNEVSEWASEVNKYCIYDINQDGTEELLLMAGDFDFYSTLICSYDRDKKEVIIVENIPNSYGVLRYDKNTKEVIYTDFRPFVDAMSYGFYTLENNKLVFSKSVGQDMGQYFVNEKGNEKNIKQEESSSYFKNAEDFEFIEISNLNINENNTSKESNNGNTTQETSNVIKAGNYTLKYGIYKDQYGTVYTLNQDGTYTCGSTSSGIQYTPSGTYIIWNYHDYEKEIDDWETQHGGEPIGFSGDWILSINPNNAEDSSKPFLLYSFNIIDNNCFRGAQTDEIWKYQGN